MLIQDIFNHLYRFDVVSSDEYLRALAELAIRGGNNHVFQVHVHVIIASQENAIV